MSRKSGLFASILALMLAAAVPAALAGPIGYAVDADDNSLYTIDLSTSTATLIGYTGQLFEGIALSPDGTLFGTDSSGRLWTIDKTTAVPTRVGTTVLGDLEGLDFNGTTLIACHVEDPTSIYSLDTGTGVPTLLVTTPSGFGVTNSLAALTSTSALILTTNYIGWPIPPNTQTLRSVDLNNGAVTTLGPSNATSLIAGIDFAGSTLYGLDISGDVYTINPLNGATMLLGNTGGQSWVDLTIAPVPEPISMIFFGTGLVGVVGYVARRRNR